MHPDDEGRYDELMTKIIDILRANYAGSYIRAAEVARKIVFIVENKQ